MRYLTAFLVISIVAVPEKAQGQTLADAEQRYLRGNYAEAREQFEKLAEKPEHRVVAAIGISRAWQSEGEYDKALDVINAELKKTPSHASLLARQGEICFLRGRWEEAEKAVQEALAKDKDNFLAHWTLAQLHRDRGDFKKAGDELVWFVRTYAAQGERLNDPHQILLVCLAELERSRWDRRLIDQFEVVLNDLLSPLSKKHKDFWPAEYEAGRLFLEKYNFAQASQAFDKALAINPRAAEALVAKGVAAFHRFDLDDAQQLAEQALTINPSLTSALRLQADIHLLADADAEALKFLNKAREVNPREEATLARLAACHLLAGREKEFQSIVKEVLKQNPKAGLFYAELADTLEGRKWYPDAEKFYRQALKLRPHLTAPRNHLGLLHMRLGQEEDARLVLEEAIKADPFNVRVVNSLRVLDHLESYTNLQTEHFTIRFDPKHDLVLARFMAKYLEEAYAELADLYQFRPQGPILFEILNSHEMFSGRTIAQPDLHTVGACTGRMVAMVSPRDKGKVLVKPFNWVRVMRHELVHVFNLEQTGFKVPHWLTEGLAVSNEPFPMPPSWLPLLRNRLASNELFNLDNINMGFIRPTSPEDWNFAYLQSFQYVEYLKKAHGKGRIGEFLNAYAEGLSTKAIVEKYCKVPVAEFEKGYRGYLEELSKKVSGKPPEKALSFKDLEKAVADDPNNPELNAQLAERFMLLGDKIQARKLAEKALAERKNHPLATYVLTQFIVGEDKQRAIAMLEDAIDPAAPDAKVLGWLASLRLQAKEFDAAGRILEQLRKAEPYEIKWLENLALVYRETNKSEKLIGVLTELLPLAPDDLQNRRVLAQLFTKSGKHAEAERYAREALEIDVLDTAAQQYYEAALRAQKKDAEADEFVKMIK